MIRVCGPPTRNDQGKSPGHCRFREQSKSVEDPFVRDLSADSSKRSATRLRGWRHDSVTTSALSDGAPTRDWGVVAAPNSGGPYPVAVLLHGNHPTCPTDTGGRAWPCPPGTEEPNRSRDVVDHRSCGSRWRHRDQRRGALPVRRIDADTVARASCWMMDGRLRAMAATNRGRACRLVTTARPNVLARSMWSVRLLAAEPWMRGSLAAMRALAQSCTGNRSRGANAPPSAATSSSTSSSTSCRTSSSTSCRTSCQPSSTWAPPLVGAVDGSMGQLIVDHTVNALLTIRSTLC